jgi:5-methylcytosine-specific restriction endonuclease McrA
LAHNPSAQNLLKGYQMKNCYKCKEVKSKSEFCKDKSRHDGLQARCKSCDKLIAHAHYINNVEKIAKVGLIYRTNNKEKIAIKGKNYYLNNREKILKTCAYYKLTNVLKIKLRNKEYNLANRKLLSLRGKAYRAGTPEQQKVYRHIRRGREQNADGFFTSLDIKNLLLAQNSKCVYCQIELITKGAGIYHVDHIMPLKLGGSNYPENLQLLCSTCNLSKSATHPDIYEKQINHNQNKES